jgi:hypothetical protein
MSTGRARWPLEVDGAARWRFDGDGLPGELAGILERQLQAMLLPREAEIIDHLEARLRERPAAFDVRFVANGQTSDDPLEWHRQLPVDPPPYAVHTLEKTLVQAVLEHLGSTGRGAIAVAHKEACESIRRFVDETHICTLRRATALPVRQTLYRVIDPAWPGASPHELLALAEADVV